MRLNKHSIVKLGEKIRELRIAKLMTQAELAGTQITRNMLSCIENGSAQPSLSTVLYIASRLNVPAGFLLAEEGDELLYRKMNSFANIKRAYMAGDWYGCRSLCVSSCPEPDDEICLMLANCDAEIAIMEFWNGHLRSACRFFDEAIGYSEKTMYSASYICAKAKVYFQYMRRLSPTLYSEVLDEDAETDTKYISSFSGYVDAMDALDEGNLEKAELLLSLIAEEPFYTVHIQIRMQMLQRRYGEAKKSLLGLLKADEPLNEISLYAVLCELEICCRETEDFKGAYNYANEKVVLLEKLLKDF